MTTITKYGSVTAVSSGSTWTTPSNIFANDTAYAITAGARNNDWDLIVSGFGFAIPDGSAINSISIDMAYKLSTTSSAGTISLFPHVGGVTQGTGWSSTAEPLVDSVASLDATGQLTVAQLNDANFGALIRVRRTSNTACNYSFNYVKITVVYTEPSYNFSGTTAISEIMHEVSSGTKQTTTVSAISEMHHVVDVGQKGTRGTSSISEPVHNISSGNKVELIIKTGTVAISFKPNAVAVGAKSGRSPPASVSLGHNVISTGVKKTTGIGNISFKSIVVATGNKAGKGITSTSHGSQVVIIGNKNSKNIVAISLNPTVTTVGKTQTIPTGSSSIGISLRTNETTSGYKSGTGVSNISVPIEYSINWIKSVSIQTEQSLLVNVVVRGSSKKEYNAMQIYEVVGILDPNITKVQNIFNHTFLVIGQKKDSINHVSGVMTID